MESHGVPPPPAIHHWPCQVFDWATAGLCEVWGYRDPSPSNRMCESNEALGWLRPHNGHSSVIR